LAWQTTNATDISIDGIGAIQANGSQSVSPATSMTYRLIAKGAGRDAGSDDAADGDGLHRLRRRPRKSRMKTCSTRTSTTYTSTSTSLTFAQTSRQFYN
jgi:hypothetical protein